MGPSGSFKRLTSILLLFLYCCLISELFLSTMANEEEASEQQYYHKKTADRVRRHPKSRQRTGATAECIQGYKQRIEHHCRYPSTEQPCFQQTVPEWAQSVEETSKNCCSGTGLCSVEDFEGLCCRTPECLEKCYGKPFLQRFRDRFRYLDILLRPHPHSSGRSSRHLDALAEFDDEAEEEEETDDFEKEEDEALKDAEDLEEEEQEGMNRNSNKKRKLERHRLNAQTQ